MSLFLNITRFMLLIAAQLLIFNHLEFSNGFVYPQVYVLALLLLPIEISTWLAIIIAFCTGLIIDMGQSTYGMHAFSCVTMVFLRSSVLTFLSPREGYDFNSSPDLRDQGFLWYLIYGSILIFIHHFCLFLLEKYSWFNFLNSLLKIVLSVLVTLVLTVLIQLLFSRKKTSS